MAIQITFLLDDSSERAQVAKCINALEEKNTSSIEDNVITPNSQQQEIGGNSAEVERLKQEIVDLKDAVKRYRKQTEKDQTLIGKLGEDIATLRKENEAKVKDAEDSLRMAEESEGKLKESNKQWQGKIDALVATHKENVRNLNEQYNSEKELLNRRIEALKKQLEAYVPSISSMGSNEKRYFKIDGDYLAETLSNEAPYMAIDTGEGYCFQFNYEKGPVGEACRNKEMMLLPFCEITDNVEGASGIVPDGWGLAIMSGGVLKVQKKAKVKLERR